MVDENNLDNLLDDGESPLDEGTASSSEYTPIFKAYKGAKIPISRAEGKIWKARIDASTRRREQLGIPRAWEEAVKYFFNDQLRHRSEGDPDVAQNEHNARKIDDRFSETENVVFSNTLAQIPMLYAKNPVVEFTSRVDSDVAKEQARILEKLVKTLFIKKNSPGVNIKAKAKRAVLQALLTNRAVMIVDYVHKVEANDAVLEAVSKIAEELATENLKKDRIEELEGQLLSLYEKAAIEEPSGPLVKMINCDQLIVDTASLETDLSDANWAAYYEFLPTKYIQQTYGEKDESGQYKSIYKPTHVLKVSQTHEDSGDIYDLAELTDSQSGQSFGYSDNDAFADGQRTKVWWVWDKIKRQVLMYNDKDWSYPVWVWDDPLHLDRFYPMFILEFYTNPLGGEGKGEVTYYLDQQDAINSLNSDKKRAMLWARKNLFYDKNRVNKADVEKILKGDEDTCTGIDVPEGMKIADMIEMVAPPNVAIMQMFNKEEYYQAIDRISSTSDVLRGAQFKTNTTNVAIEKYESINNTRQDEKIDAIEDFLGDIGWAIAQMCLQFMSQEQVIELIGDRDGQFWQNMTAQDIRRMFSCQVVGGSTSKPTSKAKKAEALEAGQVLGQFTNVSPLTLVIVLKMFEQAFDEVVITDKEWKMLIDSIQQMMQQPPQGAGSGQEAQTQDPQAIAEQVIQRAVEQGVPPDVAQQMVAERMQQQPQGN